MSYSPMENEDSLSELVSRNTDALCVLKQAEGSLRSPDSFEIWFAKAVQVSKRLTYLWCVKNRKELERFGLYEICLRELPELNRTSLTKRDVLMNDSLA